MYSVTIKNQNKETTCLTFLTIRGTEQIRWTC